MISVWSPLVLSLLRSAILSCAPTSRVAWAEAFLSKGVDVVLPYVDDGDNLRDLQAVHGDRVCLVPCGSEADLWTCTWDAYDSRFHDTHALVGVAHGSPRDGVADTLKEKLRVARAQFKWYGEVFDSVVDATLQRMDPDHGGGILGLVSKDEEMSTLCLADIVLKYKAPQCAELGVTLNILSMAEKSDPRQAGELGAYLCSPRGRCLNGVLIPVS